MFCSVLDLLRETDLVIFFLTLPCQILEWRLSQHYKMIYWVFPSLLSIRVWIKLITCSLNALEHSLMNPCGPAISFWKYLTGNSTDSDSKESACQCRRRGFNLPGSGRSPRGGHGSPLLYSCLGNLTDSGAWWATVHGVAESNKTEPLTLSLFHFLFQQSYASMTPSILFILCFQVASFQGIIIVMVFLLPL